MKSPDWLETFQTNQRLANAAGFAIHAFMMACLGISFVQFINRIAPDLRLEALPVLCFLVAIEAALTCQATEEMELRQKILYRGAEWVTLGVVTKLLTYFYLGFERLIPDLSAWQADMLEFFEPNYLVFLILMALVWWITRFYAQDLLVLNSQREDWSWDGGKLDNDRQVARQNLLDRVLTMGILVFFVTMGARVDIQWLWGDRLPFHGTALNVVLYFALGYVLFSLTQFSYLRGRWFWARIPITDNLWQRWVKYALIFFVLLGLAVLLLPTNFAVGLLDAFSYLLSAISQMLIFILNILLAPLMWLFSLFSTQSAEGEAPPPVSTPPPPIAESPPGEPIPWLEVAKALLFWGVFLGIILFSLWSVARRNLRWGGYLTRLPLFTWLARFWHILGEFIRGAKGHISQAVKAGLVRLRPRSRLGVGKRLRELVDYRHLTAREKVVFFYLRLLARGKEHGLERRKSQTPIQYEHALEQALPEVEPDVKGITASFLEARYSRHDLSEEEPERVKRWWSKIARALRRKSKTADREQG